jgi:anti-sigma factor RsiW
VSSRLELLHAYHDGELGALRRWRVRRWLARDPAARSELEALATLGEAVRQSQVAPPAPDVWAGLEGRLRSIDAEREVSGSAAGSGLRLGSMFRPAAAGAVLAGIVVAFALFMVLDEGDATIIWLMQPDADQAGRKGGWLGLI